MLLAMILALALGITIIVLTYPNRVADWFWTQVFKFMDRFH